MSVLKGLCLVFLSALLFVLGQPNALFGDGLFFLSFIALIPVFYILHALTLRDALWSSLCWSCLLGFCFGLLVYTGLCFWLIRYERGLFFVAVTAYAVLYGLLFGGMQLLSRSYPAFAFPVMALSFCVLEYLKSLGPLGFSYGIIGYSQWTFRPLLMTAAIGGVWIPSCFCVFFSALCTEILVKYHAGLDRRTFSSLAILFSCTVVFSLLGFQVSLFGVEYRDITAVLIQNNADASKYAEDGYKNDISNLVSLSEEALGLYPDADFVVWPETAVVPPILQYYHSRKDVSRFNAVSSVLGLMLRNRACFIIGNQHVDADGEDCNAALVFDREKGTVVPPAPELYVKQHLVPFSESLPFYTVFRGLYDRVFPDRSFIWKAGDCPQVFSGRGISYAVPICFEDTFGSLCSQFVREGAFCLFSICNDSWAASPVCQRQHLAMTVFRAVENGVPVLRSSASGVTCIINADGQITGELDGFCAGFLGRKISVPTKRRPYPYSLYGDWFAQTELFLLCILVAWACVKRYSNAGMKSQKQKAQKQLKKNRQME